MINKEKSYDTRTRAILVDQNGEKPAFFLESLDFHRFTFKLGMPILLKKKKTIIILNTPTSSQKL